VQKVYYNVMMIFVA